VHSIDPKPFAQIVREKIRKCSVDTSRGKFKVVRVVRKQLSRTQSRIEKLGHQRPEKNRVTIHGRAHPRAPRYCFIHEGPELFGARDRPRKSHASTNIEDLGFIYRTVRSIGNEILVGKTDLSYTYTQPVRTGQTYILYHGTLEAKPLTGPPEPGSCGLHTPTLLHAICSSKKCVN
jgi:hypothetical protein